MKNYLLLWGLFLQSLSIVAQIPKPPVNVQSPNAASLGVYGEYKLSSFTGSPSIGVNLMTVNDGALSIPLSLSYNASGVKPDVHPGWVGLNFNIDVGGAITRTVKDLPDDTPANLDVNLPRPGYFYSDKGGVNLSNWNTANGIKLIAQNDAIIPHDTEPDEFNFNMMGISGKFYFGHDNTFKVQSEQDIKVEFIGNSSNTYPPFIPQEYSDSNHPWLTYNNGHYQGHVAGFILTDENGTKYEFGGGNNAYMEYSMRFFYQGNGKETWICNAWYLKSVTTATGQVINFTYERGDFIAQINPSIHNKKFSVNGGGFLAPNCSGWNSLYELSGPYDGKLISPVYLKEITTKNIKINFTSSTTNELPYEYNIFSQHINYRNTYPLPGEVPGLNSLICLYECYYPTTNSSCASTSLTPEQLIARLKWRKLDKISIVNTYDNKTEKEFEFTYNNVPTERLMLQKVQEKSTAVTEVIPPYEFFYYSDPIISLPNYCKSHTDHWGFNNGKNLNYPNDFADFANYGANFRSPATDNKYYLVGTLNKIKYPLGGVTEFTFEPHTYSKEVKLNRNLGVDDLNTTLPSGGLRIKIIKSYDPINTNSVIEKTFYYITGFNPKSPNYNLLSSGVLGGKTQYFWNDYSPQVTGNAVNYLEQVFSSQSVLPSSENSMGSHIGYSEIVEKSSTGGWTVYKYSNFDNGYIDDAFEAHLQASATYYEPFNSKSFTRGKLLSKTDYFGNGNLLNKQSYTYMPVGSDYVRSVRTALKPLCNNTLPGATDVIEGTAYKIYTYKFKLQQEESLVYDQADESKYITAVTNYDYNVFGQVNVIKKTQSDGSELITKIKYIPEYTYTGISNRVSEDVDAILKMKDKHIWSSVEELKYLKRNSEEQIIGGNININKEFTFNSARNLLPSKIYKLQLSNPIASNSLIFSTINADGSFTFDSRYGTPEMQFVDYNEEGNLLELKDKGNISTSYLWGYRNRRPIVEVKNNTYNELVTLLTTTTINDFRNNIKSENEILNFTNSLRSAVSGHVTSYTHNVLFGVTSTTDPANRTNYFKYDGFGRLSNIKNSEKELVKSYQYNVVPPTTATSASTLSFSAQLDARNEQINLSFAYPTAEVVKYEIRRGQGNEPLKPWVTVDGNNTNKIDPSYTPNQNIYKYEIRAILSNGSASEWQPLSLNLPNNCVGRLQLIKNGIILASSPIVDKACYEIILDEGFETQDNADYTGEIEN